MDDKGMGGLLIGALLAIAGIGKLVWDRVFSTPAVAESRLYAQLSERMTQLDASLAKVQEELDDERTLRRHAQNRIALLETELAKHGIEIPADPR